MHRRLCFALLSLSLACGEDAPDAAPSVPAGKLVISADWLARSITFADRDKLEAQGATRSTAMLGELKLPDYAPGPLELELTPDKRTLLVSVSAGFFSIPGAGIAVNAGNIPQGPGKLLFVDVESRKVEAALDTGDGPMGAACTPDGKRAFVAHFGSGDVAIVDLAQHKVLSRVSVGSFAEELAFDDTGTVGVVGYSAAGSVRTFGVEDMEGTLSPSVDLTGDSAGIAFFPGTKIAMVAQTANAILSQASGYTLIDVSDPRMPRVLEDVRKDDGIICYPLVATGARGTLLMPVTQGGRLVLREYALGGEKVSLRQSIDVGEAQLLSALGVSFDGAHSAIMARPGSRSLVITDLDAASSKVVPWQQDVAGPADVVVR
jgi:DNA-binding beta-propeller fold protein YncE